VVQARRLFLGQRQHPACLVGKPPEHWVAPSFPTPHLSVPLEIKLHRVCRMRQDIS
jgi:hypothetical protein